MSASHFGSGSSGGRTCFGKSSAARATRSRIRTVCGATMNLHARGDEEERGEQKGP